MQLALLYLLDCGSSERPIDFSAHYRSSWLGVAILSSFACCNGDTWASEIGTVVGRSDPFLITTRKRVPRGTNGGVTLIGLAVRFVGISFNGIDLQHLTTFLFYSFLGGIIVGLGYYVVVRYTVERNILAASPPQWPIIVVGGIAGFLGSVIDSVIGATLQYSGQDAHGRIVERPGRDVKHISGYRLLDNHSVNLISSILTGLIMPFIAFNCWT